jgi:hypothetical protein
VSFSNQYRFRTSTITAGFHHVGLFPLHLSYFLYQYNAQPQDIARVSPHFTVLLLLPSRVDHLTLPSTKPDPRRPAHYESVLQPSKTGVRARNVVCIALSPLDYYFILSQSSFDGMHFELQSSVCCAFFGVFHSHGGCTSSTRQKQSGRRPN